LLNFENFLKNILRFYKSLNFFLKKNLALNGQTPEVYRVANFCMQRQLADSCVEFLSSWDCKRTERFMKKCPTTRPMNGVQGAVVFESYP
jgi:hypothetical protein